MKMAPKATPKKAAKAPAKATKVMSSSHKAALAVGRDQGRSVRAYLEALEAHKPKRGRKRTPDSIQKRLNAVAAGENFDALLVHRCPDDVTAVEV